jgi:hypothetical protein
MLPEQFEVARAGQADHGRAGANGELCGGEADAARCTRDHDGLAWPRLYRFDGAQARHRGGVERTRHVP